MAAQPEYTDYIRVACSIPNVGSETNLFASMHCPRCKLTIQELAKMLGNAEAAALFVKWGGNLGKRIPTKDGKKVRVKDLTNVQTALAQGIKPDHRFLPGATLTLEDLQQMFEADTDLFLIRSGWYQPNHLSLIKQHSPELWQKILDLLIQFGVIQNVPLDDATVTLIREKLEEMILKSTNFLSKLKKYRAVGLVSEKTCEGLISPNQTNLLLELSLDKSRVYGKAMFGQNNPEHIRSYFNALCNDKSLMHWMGKTHDVRALPLFEKISQDYVLDEDVSWKSYPVFEIFIFADKACKKVSGGLIFDLFNSPNPNLSASQRDRLVETWKKYRRNLGISLETPPMTCVQFRKYILVRMIGEIREEIAQYHSEKSSSYICSGKPI